MMGRVACIDIGTVTCRLAVADVRDRRVLALHKRSTICDLGEGLTRTGRLSDAAIRRVTTCVDGYLAEMHAMQVPVVCCTLTSAARDASNSDELLAALAARGLDAQVIAGDIEGRLTLLGVAQDFPDTMVLVADNGGGSTELALGRLTDDGLDARAIRSVDVGCRRITERFLSAGDPPAPEDLAAAHAFAAEPFEAAVRELHLREGGAERLIVTGGTVTSLVAIEHELVPYDSRFVHLHELSRESVERLERRLASITLAERAELPGLQPQRAGVMLGGTVAISELLRATGFDRLTVSESDLLYGLTLTVDGVRESGTSPIGWMPQLSVLE